MILTAITLGVHLVSAHIPAGLENNNLNPGVYAKVDGFVAGVYRNTLRRTSFYAGYAFEHGPFALTVGAITGYDKRTKKVYTLRNANDATLGGTSSYETTGYSSSKVSPLIAPSVRLPEVFGITPRITYLPRLGIANRSNVFHLSIERAL